MTNIYYLVSLVIWVVCLIDFLKPDASAYEGAGTSKTLWIVLTVFFSWIAWLIFHFTGKRAAVRGTAA